LETATTSISDAISDYGDPNLPSDAKTALSNLNASQVPLANIVNNSGEVIPNVAETSTDVTSIEDIITTTSSGGTATGTVNFNLSKDGSATAISLDTADSSDNTSQITTFTSDGSSTTTYYSSPNGKGSVTEVDQENANGTSQITIYGSGGLTTTTTYSGPNGTGSITGVSIKNATASIVSSIDPWISKFTYTGGPMSGVFFCDSRGFVIQGALYGGGQTFEDQPSGQIITNNQGQVTTWDIQTDQIISAGLGGMAAIANYTHPPGQGGEYYESLGSPPLYPTYQNPDVAVSWSYSAVTTSVTVSPLAGQTQSLSAVLSNPSLTAQGAIQNLTINGPGVVGVTGANSVPNLANDGFMNVGGTLDVSRAVDPSSSGVFFLTGQGDLEIGEILGGGNLKMQFLGSNSSNRLTIDNAADFGAQVGTTSYAGPLLEGFIAGDGVDLKGIASAGLNLAYSATSGDLQITGNGKALATLAFQNSSLGAGAFHMASDGAGGTLITHS
jgi:hypothetical protein